MKIHRNTFKEQFPYNFVARKAFVFGRDLLQLQFALNRMIDTVCMPVSHRQIACHALISIQSFQRETF